MTDSATLSRDDLRLLDALQLAPRASWATIGSALGLSAVTAAKRWTALNEVGTAWVTAAPGMTIRNAQCVAYVEITCRPEHAFDVANAFAAHSLAITVEITTGSADILVTVAAADLRTLSHYLLVHLPAVQHVLSSRARIATRLYGEGSSWRLRVLEDDVVGRLEQRSHQHRPPETLEPEGVEIAPAAKTMLTHLTVNGRASFAELAERAGTSTTTARRHVSRLLDSHAIMLRTDVNAFAVGWPVQVYLWADAPVAKLHETARALSAFRQSRLTATVTAGPGLALCCWLRTVEEVHRLEMLIASRLPHVDVVDRLIVLRQIKRMGRLIDEHGQAVGVVPMNIWDDLLPHPESQSVSL